MAQVTSLISLLRGRRVVALTGAGISTESGIPDYRGPGTRHKVRRPVQHRDFIEDPRARARYWARSTVGWPRFRGFEPNQAHHALARLQRGGQVLGVITQNVDRLHQKAGSEGVLELHGALAEVRCLACSALEPRDSLQTRLLEQNPQALRWAHQLAPDGDVDLSDDEVQGFQVPGCAACGGVLKPDVVFFGDSVPRPRVEAAYALADSAEVLLVVGSSLAVFSGYRFVLRAVERGQPVALLNLGESRGDAHAQVRVDAAAGEVLPRVAEALVG
jgi:NAD-dependent SIR2 family protein deacetylase